MSLPETSGGDPRYQDEHLTVDPERAAVWLDGRLLRLTRKQFELLAMLVQHANEVVPREVLLATVWGYGPGVRSRTLDVHIRRLRKHLGRFGNLYIETIFGKGYRFRSFAQNHRRLPDESDADLAFMEPGRASGAAPTAAQHYAE